MKTQISLYPSNIVIESTNGSIHLIFADDNELKTGVLNRTEIVFYTPLGTKPAMESEAMLHLYGDLINALVQARDKYAKRE